MAAGARIDAVALLCANPSGAIATMHPPHKQKVPVAMSQMSSVPELCQGMPDGAPGITQPTIGLVAATPVIPSQPPPTQALAETHPPPQRQSSITWPQKNRSHLLPQSSKITAAAVPVAHVSHAARVPREVVW